MLKQHCRISVPYGRSYVQLYKQHLQGTLGPEGQQEIEQLERVLVADDVVLFRFLTLSEMQV